MSDEKNALHLDPPPEVVRHSCGLGAPACGWLTAGGRECYRCGVKR